jgi:hypothetical protein
MNNVGVDFWIGILIGFAFSVEFLVVHGEMARRPPSRPNFIDEIVDIDGTRQCRFFAQNVGHRDAVDVAVKCTLYSTAWANGPPDLIATIDIPLTVRGLVLMPGRGPSAGGSSDSVRLIVFLLPHVKSSGNSVLAALGLMFRSRQVPDTPSRELC